MGEPFIEGKIIEEEIIENLTNILINKTYEKIKVENNGWENKYIPQLLGRIWHDFVTEEIWNILKKFNNPKIDFKTLQYFCIKRIKEKKSDIF